MLHVLSAVLLWAGALGAQDGFDRQRYIDVDEIKPGMRGYGLTVFQGTKIEKFDVVVVSVINNRLPKQDAILIRCEDERFTKAKIVGGVSGSPVYFKGKMAGAMAFAFGQPFWEDPLYGVTPIRQMLEVRRTGQMGHHKRKGEVCLKPQLYQDLMREELLGQEQIDWLAKTSGLTTGMQQGQMPQEGMTTLPLTMNVSGISNGAIQLLQQWVPTLNLSEMAAGENIVKDWQGKIKLAPGSTLTIPLVTGDMSWMGLGTVTEVVGDQVYGFGHSLEAGGATVLPMGTGYVHTFIRRLSRSSKLGQVVDIVGSIRADEVSAVYGVIGQKAPMVPIELEVEWPYLGCAENFEVQIIQDEYRDPFLVLATMIQSLLHRGELPFDHSINYKIEMQFDGVDAISFENITSQSNMRDLADDVLGALALILKNPWEELKLTRVKMKASIFDTSVLAEIKSAQLSSRYFQSGDKVSARLVLQPLRAEVQEEIVELELPTDLPQGKYKITIGSALEYRRQLQGAQPHRYEVFNAHQLQQVLQERLSLKRNGIYISLPQEQTGVALEREEFWYLPASKAMLLTDQSRKIMATRFRPMTTSYTAMDYIILNSETFDIEVRKE